MNNTLGLPPDEYLTEVGRVVAAWSHVEFRFHLLYLSMVVMRGASKGVLDADARTLMGLPLERQLEKFRGRLEEIELSPENRKKAETILSQLLTLRRERDRVAHSQLTLSLKDEKFDPGVANALFKSWKNTKEIDMTQMKKERLTEIAGRMQALFWDLFHFGLDPEILAQKPRQA